MRNGRGDRRLPIAVILAAAIMVFSHPGAAYAATARDAQWYLDALRIPQAHAISRGAGVTVAVIDSGINPNIPALAGRVLRGTQFNLPSSPGGMTDTDPDGHGTAMAGIIAGTGASANIPLGIAPQAKVIPIAIKEQNLGNTDGKLPDAIRWAADQGADVINISYGGAGFRPAVNVAVQYALAKDAVVVAAAGNVAKDGPRVVSPANAPGVIAVAGTDKVANSWSGTSYGAEVGVSAPAVEMVVPTLPGANQFGYGISTGTSDATAFVSGVVALVRAKYPSLNAFSVINRLVRTTQEEGAPGRDKFFGFGIVQPYEALTRDVPSVTKNPLGGPSGEPPASAGAGGSGSPVAVPSPGKDPTFIFVTPIIVCAALILIAIVVSILVVTGVRRRDRRRRSSSPIGYG